MAKLLVNVDVDDLEKAVSFYTEAFSLKVGRRFGKEAVELVGAAVPIYLLLKESGTPPFAGASEARRYARHWTPVHLDFVVEELEAAVERARQAGATVERALSQHSWGRMALLADPFGHGICLLQFQGAGYDAIATGPGPT